MIFNQKTIGKYLFELMTSKPLIVVFTDRDTETKRRKFVPENILTDQGTATMIANENIRLNVVAIESAIAPRID